MQVAEHKFNIKKNVIRDWKKQYIKLIIQGTERTHLQRKGLSHRFLQWKNRSD